MTKNGAQASGQKQKEREGHVTNFNGNDSTLSSYQPGLTSFPSAEGDHFPVTAIFIGKQQSDPRLRPISNLQSCYKQFFTPTRLDLGCGYATLICSSLAHQQFTNMLLHPEPPLTIPPIPTPRQKPALACVWLYRYCLPPNPVPSHATCLVYKVNSR